MKKRRLRAAAGAGFPLAVLLPFMILMYSTGCEESPDAGEGFSIYLSLDPGLSPQGIAATDLSTIELESDPILAAEDITSYTRETHTISLTETGRQKLENLSFPVSGRTFVVCVDHEPIYGGAFWTPVSSIPYSGVAIVLNNPLEDQAITIQLGYPGADHFTGDDPRSDTRILQALQRSSKLE